MMWLGNDFFLHLVKSVWPHERGHWRSDERFVLRVQLKNASPTVQGAFISASVSRHPQGREALEHGNALVTESMWRGEPGVAVEGMRRKSARDLCPRKKAE